MARPAGAQITREPREPFPDPSKFAKGIYADAEIGSMFFLGDAAGPLGAGVAFGARLGYDLFRWAAIQVHAVGSTHRTDFATGPQSGQLIQFYQATAELKLAIPISQFAIFAHGGAGFGHLSTNLLETAGLTGADAQTGLVFAGGGGLDYHTLTRHFSLGLAGTFSRFQPMKAPGGVLITTYLRYTF